MSQKFSFSLADIPQNIAGIIPLELITRWQESDKTIETHQALLDPYRIQGTLVCSDSAGLSKLSERVSALEAMKFVHEPKNIIYGYGNAIGGIALGIWAADNTQMFYDHSITVEDIVDQMIAAQNNIHALTVQVGLGIHNGHFIKIGNTLFGEDAAFIEEFTENETEGREIALSEACIAELSEEKKSHLRERNDSFSSRMFSLDYRALGKPDRTFSQGLYPVPFSKDFYDFLETYPANEIELHAQDMKKYKVEKVVVLVKVIQQNHFFLLDTFTDWTLCNAIMTNTVKDFEVETIKSNGDLGIFVCDDADTAVSFAKELSKNILEEGYRVHCGISSGEVLIFPLENGGKDIAGGAVNIASKIAEDSGEEGIMLHDCVECTHTETDSFSFTISGIEIHGKIY